MDLPNILNLNTKELLKRRFLLDIARSAQREFFIANLNVGAMKNVEEKTT